MIVIKSHHAGNVEIGADGYPKRTKDRFDVYLNGEKLRFCVYANEEQGEAEVLKFAPNGKFEVSPYRKFATPLQLVVVHQPHDLQLQGLAIEAVGYSHYYERSP